MDLSASLNAVIMDRDKKIADLEIQTEDLKKHAEIMQKSYSELKEKIALLEIEKEDMEKHAEIMQKSYSELEGKWVLETSRNESYLKRMNEEREAMEQSKIVEDKKDEIILILKQQLEKLTVINEDLIQNKNEVTDRIIERIEIVSEDLNQFENEVMAQKLEQFKIIREDVNQFKNRVVELLEQFSLHFVSNADQDLASQILEIAKEVRDISFLD